MRYLEITSPDINNGTGCRVTLWIAGCTHHCKGCQNQHTWNFNQGKPLWNDEGVDVIEKLSEILDKPYIQGLTISGGDPFAGQTKPSLHQLAIVLDVIKRKYPQKDIWLFTGDTWETDIITNPLKLFIAKMCDVIVDGEFKLKEKDTSLAFKGSKNQRLIDVKQTLEKGKVVLLDLKD